MQGALLCCLAMRQVYARLGALLGPDGALYTYSDDVYLLSDPVSMSIVMVDAPTIYMNVRLRI